MTRVITVPIWLALCASLVFSLHIQADVFEGSPGNYRELLKGLKPGDTLLLAPGEYRQGLPVHNLSGEKESPIIISGPKSGPRPIFFASPERNTVSIVNASFVTIRNLELNGQGLPVDGVKAEGHAEWTHHITLENLIIRGHDNNQQTVGISTKCPAWGWVIRGNVISGAGTGMYLGNSDGSDPFVDGLIERNVIANTTGYNLQIKHQQVRPEMPGIPTGKSTTIIRHNVFIKEEGGAKGPMARPNVLVGHWPLEGAGSEDMYLIYGNFFYQNPDEALFQGEGNVALYSNLMVNAHGDAVNIQPHNDIPRAVSVFYNTVVATGSGIKVQTRADKQAGLQRVAGNAIFAGIPLAGGIQEANIMDSFAAASRYLSRPFAPLGELDLYPKPGKLQGEPMPIRVFNAFPEWNRDFNDRPRKGNFRGAYGGEGVNPGWRLAAAPKPYDLRGGPAKRGSSINHIETP
ncbi:MAG: hypothetical protein M3A44_03720 [Gammaproteobacteria bacterium]